MESWFYSCWIYFWMTIILFRNISADPGLLPRYTVHQHRFSFDRAMEDCFPGVLTTLATEQEVTDILWLISKSVSPLNQNEFTFWVGLRKVKNECVVTTLPLRGFKWTENGSEESQVSRWTVEPKHTCTTVRCAALKVEFNGTTVSRSTVSRWGLIPVSCRNSYQFICKPPVGRETSVKLATPEPATPEPHKSEPRPATQTPESTTSEPRPATQTPESTTSEPELATQGPEPKTDLNPGSEPALGSDSCQRPLIHGARSLSLDPDSNQIQVECWSTVQLQLHCSGRPAVWRLLDGSPANFSSICQPCEDGFQKDTSGNCVDINECNASPCRHTCLNTEGSYRCVCSDENGKHHKEDSATCTDTATDSDSGLLSGILIPVLIAVAVLVVLVVFVAVTVKCCLMRRSKKRAMKKAEKMAMKSQDDKDSFGTANEKVTI